MLYCTPIRKTSGKGISDYLYDGRAIDEEREKGEFKTEYYLEKRKGVCFHVPESLEGFWDRHLSGLKSSKEKVDHAVKLLSSRVREGYDITFSPDKSLSIGYYILGDRRIEEAYQKTEERLAEEILKRVETRIQKGGKTIARVRADGFLMSFRHDLSRANDPCLHTHYFLCNKAKCPDGKFRAVAPEKVFNDTMTLDIIANYVLAKELQDRGIAIEFKRNAVKLKGIDEKARKVFSKRREDILELLEKSECKGRKTSNRIAKFTRRKKKYTRLEDLREQWNKQLEQAGIDLHALAKNYEQANENYKTTRELSFEEYINVMRETILKFHKTEMTQRRLFKEFTMNLFKYVNKYDFKLKDLDEHVKTYEKALNKLAKEKEVVIKDNRVALHPDLAKALEKIKEVTRKVDLKELEKKIQEQVSLKAYLKKFEKTSDQLSETQEKTQEKETRDTSITRDKDKGQDLGR